MSALRFLPPLARVLPLRFATGALRRKLPESVISASAGLTCGGLQSLQWFRARFVFQGTSRHWTGAATTEGALGNVTRESARRTCSARPKTATPDRPSMATAPEHRNGPPYPRDQNGPSAPQKLLHSLYWAIARRRVRPRPGEEGERCSFIT